ncbi:hypothetical protein J4461_02415 [Candidatus Pacearchaeota archaeon]|nr:hypothetical protein [Candidatus Pacearchaeota archaeon]
MRTKDKFDIKKPIVLSDTKKQINVTHVDNPPIFLPSMKDLFYIVHDAIEGRREIPVGAGKVQICIGHYIERDKFGRRRDAPAYRTQTF